MKKWQRNLAIALLLVFIGPFLVPVPPVKGAVPVEKLAEDRSRFTQLKGVNLHYKVYGVGEPVFVLLHGFGASTFSWRDVAQPLARQGTVVLFDRPGFGLTQRPLNWEGENPYSREFSAALVFALLDHLGHQEAILVGHSAGGGVAVEAALTKPERVKGLVLVAPALEGRKPSWFMKVPQVRRLGPLFVRIIARVGERGIRQSWYDEATLTPQVFEGYKKPLRAENWDRGLWSFTLASTPGNLQEGLASLQMPALVISGEHDRIVPLDKSLAAALPLKGSHLVIIPGTGHLPQEEQPGAFLEAVLNWLKTWQ
jgi:pimeloyl-ACP methyl ester carboxylesterase